MKLKSLPLEERPREKMIKHGPKFLTNSELLAIILGTGNKNENVLALSNKIFNSYNLKSLSLANVSKLAKEPGIGEAKSCQMAACFELGRRLSSFKEEKRSVIKNAKDIVNIFGSEMNLLKQEHLKAVYLDSRNKVIKEQTIFIGSLNESIINQREIFKIALEENATSIILIHNHPSGDPNPSMSDIEATQEILKSADMLKIPLIDHIILGDKKYFSFKEKGLI
jgi:DNA repair protein RadC